MAKDLGIAMELFFHAKRAALIAERAYRVQVENNRKMHEIGNTLENYAMWQIGTLLLHREFRPDWVMTTNNKRPCIVSAIHFCRPEESDLIPRFNYACVPVLGVTKGSSIVVCSCSDNFSIDSDYTKDYREPDRAEIKQLLVSLPKLRENQRAVKGNTMYIYKVL